ncbi:MAG TPA: LuxR C-terminal-related transcriptional regulator [Beutenbergiaceae bacterium]|nr:LuxR C-terminal-related transcriptional regulator [Beutenbergiaceae bacterium]
MLDPELAILRLDRPTARLYRSLLAKHTCTTLELADDHGEPVVVIRERLEQLRTLGLVNSLARANTYTAIDPRRALRAIADATEEDLLALRRATTPLARTFDTGKSTAEVPSQATTVVRGPDALAAAFTRIQQEAEAEILSFDRPPYALATANPVEPVVLRRGVRWRAVYVPESFDHAGAWEDAQQQVSDGEHARLAAQLPTKLAIADARLAMVLTCLDPDGFEAVVTTAPALIDALTTLFEQYWGSAVDIPSGAEYPGGAVPDARPSADERALLALMAGGTTDAAAARSLGISPRTLRRRVAALLERLGAANRFQAAVAATRRGWI